MGIVDTVRSAFENPGDGTEKEPSEGSYWCHDCGKRIRDVDHDGEDAPACPDCGDEMSFERTPDSGDCAC